jgi:Ca2+-binding EF-hand superfamily protein
VDDLRRAFGVVLGEALTAQQIEVIVQNMMRKFDDNGDGMIDEAEFRRFLSAEDYELRFTMNELYPSPAFQAKKKAARSRSRRR